MNDKEKKKLIQATLDIGTYMLGAWAEVIGSDEKPVENWEHVAAKQAYKQFLEELVQQIEEDALTEFCNSLELPPHVDGDEGQEYLVQTWVAHMGLIDAHREDYNSEIQSRFTLARAELLERWAEENEPALILFRREGGRG